MRLARTRSQTRKVSAGFVEDRRKIDGRRAIQGSARFTSQNTPDTGRQTLVCALHCIRRSSLTEEGTRTVPKRAFVATLFNLLFEYSIRGVNDLAVHPLLPLFLFLHYFAYFILLDDFVRACQAGPLAVGLAGFAYGCVSCLFWPGTMFDNAWPLGIHWGRFLFVNTVWWGMLQGVVTMYAASRVVPRTSNEDRLNWPRRVLVILWLLSILAVFRASAGRAAQPSGVGAATALVLGISSFSGAVIAAHRCSAPRQRSRLLDAIVLATIGVFLFSSLLLTRDPVRLAIHRVNLTALRVVSVWTLVVFLATLTETVIRRRRVVV